MKQFLITQSVENLVLDKVSGEATLCINAESIEDARKIAETIPKENWHVSPVSYNIVSYDTKDKDFIVQDITQEEISTDEYFDFNIDEGE